MAITQKIVSGNTYPQYTNALVKDGKGNRAPKVYTSNTRHSGSDITDDSIADMDAKYNGRMKESYGA